MEKFRARRAENKLVSHRWLLKNASKILVEYILNTLLHLPSLKAGCNKSSGEMGSPGDELLDRLQSYQLFLLLPSLSLRRITPITEHPTTQSRYRSIGIYQDYR